MSGGFVLRNPLCRGFGKRNPLRLSQTLQKCVRYISIWRVFSYDFNFGTKVPPVKKRFSKFSVILKISEIPSRG